MSACRFISCIDNKVQCNMPYLAKLIIIYVYNNANNILIASCAMLVNKPSDFLSILALGTLTGKRYGEEGEIHSFVGISCRKYLSYMLIIESSNCFSYV